MLSTHKSRDFYAPFGPDLVHNSKSNNPGPVFEFTKRKKWADLLINELAGTIMLVLSPEAEVLYCGSAAAELVGWKEDDVIDVELATLLHEDDVQPFLVHFDACITAQTEMSTFARFRGNANDTKWPLFELRGHPHFDRHGQLQCFFAMARPYPSRNTAMLDSFLELKTENEKLRQRLLELRGPSFPPPYLSANLSNVRSEPESAASYQHAASIRALPFPYAHIQPIHPFVSTSAPAQPYFVSSRRSSVDEGAGNLLNLRDGDYSSAGEGSHTAKRRSTRSRDEDDDEEEPAGREEGVKRKKARKNAPSATASAASAANAAIVQQYVCVTCGRTDSPEWRKGPLGAKTLCNACGLRWAKKTNQQKRKNDNKDGNNTDASRS